MNILDLGPLIRSRRESLGLRSANNKPLNSVRHPSERWDPAASGGTQCNSLPPLQGAYGLASPYRSAGRSQAI